MDGRHVARSSSQPGALSLYAPILRNKKAVSLGFLWLLGLYAVVLAPAPVKITEAKLAAFQAKLQEADGMMKGLAAAEKRLMDAEFRMKQVSVWFWRWRPEHRKRVEERMPAVEAAREKVTQLRRQRDGVLREAKQSLGLWSDAGIEEGRQLLWSSFSAGKVIAQRQTFWDTIFSK